MVVRVTGAGVLGFGRPPSHILGAVSVHAPESRSNQNGTSPNCAFQLCYRKANKETLLSISETIWARAR